ncbi:oxidoreductase [Rhodococcoides fascians]|uniref:PDR/VanB family oxidoreductase n=1 Tax=Rhodococcoides fascians TaxID=1828 RepID=UPI000B9B793F|nr:MULTISPECIES: PDR/VanB family oxidoreductase [Rhodococcus]OZD68987.1 oxidoreductase [Rhodococcus sp. 06-1059B-a]OZE81080.1 oxidoreductase [Rhodococcus fascians]OZF08334.1 oxidoreductase [Rhodococcus fascians]OZF12330.1 oxidoreductase [Rhodococcus fascians]OZF59090.1 oxidoreductase [Rhodococcus fascians]
MSVEAEPTDTGLAGEFDSELELVVVHREQVAHGVIALTFRAAAAGPLPAWEPGAHIDLVLENGLTRQYSLCGDPADRNSWRIGVLLEPAGRGGSAWVHEHLTVGTTITSRAPRNHFPLQLSTHYIFVAGGIGVTPLIPMVAAVEASGASWSLTYGGRTRETMAFVDELSQYDAKVRTWPQDESGILDLEEILRDPADDTLVYCCGPSPLLDAIVQKCDGWRPDALHIERFAASTVPAPKSSGASIRVDLRRSGIRVHVPANRSILDVVNEAGAGVVSSCEDGICGTCETAVIDGIPDHRDDVLSRAERASGTKMMLCVSRAKSGHLVLDI